MESSDETTEEGPWPEPDERDEPAGSKGVALAIAGLNLVFLMTLGLLLAVGVYTLITIYAIVKLVRSGTDTADPTVILLGVVGLVTLLVVLLGVGGWAIGRAADPKKRRSL